MTIYYIDPSLGTTGVGTSVSPFNTWIGVPTGAGNIYKQKRGTTWAGTFPTLTSGSAGNITTVTSYYNSDGSDDTTKALPILNLGNTSLPSSLSFFKWEKLNIINNRTEANDVPIAFLGNDSSVLNCVLTTNLTGLYILGKNRVVIQGNTITAATGSNSYSMMAITMADNPVMDSNLIDSNTIYIGNGGNSASHAIRVEAQLAANPATNLVISNNNINTLSGVLTTNASKIGIWCSNTPGAVISGNTVTNMLSGIFCNGTYGVKIINNKCNKNGNFGIHITTNTKYFTIANNQCRRNGSLVGMSYYGRGIELSGAAILNSCFGHTICFNDCSYSVNGGGVSDNGTEGVGIGLDDGTNGCFVYGNLLYKNEGNGVQFYGGSSAPTDTGGNVVCNNTFVANGLASYKNIRSGTRYMTAGASHVGLSKTSGSRTIIANNLFIDGIGGICEGATCTAVEKYNNVFVNQSSYAYSVSAVGTIGTNIYAPGIPKQIADLTVDGNGVPTPALISTGATTDRNIDPMLDSLYNPQPASPLLDLSQRRGFSWVVVPLIPNDT